MDFLDREPIYWQISRFVEERILTEEWKVGDRIPSVRDLAVALEVNPNTVARTFQLLQDAGVLENRRGIGSFVAAGAKNLVSQQAKARVESQDLPRLFRTLDLLDYGPEDLSRLYIAYRNHKKTETTR